jgi:hypothetical protein
MREHKPDKSPPPPPWRVPVTVEEVGDAGRSFALVADAEARAGIARIAGLRDLPRLQAAFEVKPQGAGGLQVVGRVSATVGQTCVVTLEPLTNEVEEAVDLLFVPRPAETGAAADGESGISPPEATLDDPEPLIGGTVDLGALATEFLILGLDPYPRKPGAVFEPPQDSKPEPGPFAALAALTKARDDH